MTKPSHFKLAPMCSICVHSHFPDDESDEDMSCRLHDFELEYEERNHFVCEDYVEDKA
jgi:hypothetical protein